MEDRYWNEMMKALEKDGEKTSSINWRRSWSLE